MSDALSIVSTGLTSSALYINNIANDLANLNTQNYKATRLSFENMVSTPSKPSQHGKTHATGLGTAITHTAIDFSTGPLKPTTNWNDVAIDGKGFFQVITTDGNIAYTRNSSLSIDSEGYLSTQEGLRLNDMIQIPDDANDIQIDKNGDVIVLREDKTTPELIGSLKLVNCLNPDSLKPLGQGLYIPSEKTGDMVTDVPGSSGLGLLLQKQVEGSNVDMVSSLMQLTLAQRIYQLNAKAAQIADEMEKMANELQS